MLTQRVLVVGGGVGGLAVGAALGRRGISVDLVEVKDDSSVLGVGINQPANSLRALRSLGVLEECVRVGFQYDRTVFNDQDGGLIVDVPSTMGGDVPANNALTRPDLQRILLGAAEDAGVKTDYGTTVRELVQREDGVDVVFTDDRAGTYDLVIGADGIRSPLRERVFGPGWAAVYTGYAVWRLTMPRPAEVTCAQLWQAVGVKAGVIPLNEREMYLLVVTCEPGQPRHRPEDFDTLLKERMAPFTGLPGRLRDSIGSPAGIVYSPLSEVLLPLPWHRGRVVVIGDAAHACAPHITQGAAMALEDAVVLAEMLAAGDDLETTLQAFGERRHPRVKLVQDVSHGILFTEMAITAETMPAAVAAMRTELPGRTAHVNDYLNQPA